ncbi:hypothetical protein IL54_4241 [Sphingobium sp. ba1]|nr:hypothetical protein IL54_4241 [Sphingobium sp. ba1]
MQQASIAPAMEQSVQYIEHCSRFTMNESP